MTVLDDIPTKSDKSLVGILKNVLIHLEENRQTTKANDYINAISITWGERCERFKTDPSFQYPADGMLSALDYHVGNEGQRRPYRRRILRYIMKYNLPPVLSPHYMEKWGEPCSQRRYDKLKSVLIGLTNSSNLTGEKYKRAKIEWMDDVKYLDENISELLGE